MGDSELCGIRPSAIGQEGPKLRWETKGENTWDAVPRSEQGPHIQCLYFIGQGKRTRPCLNHLVRATAIGVHLCSVPFLAPTGHRESVASEPQDKQNGGREEGKKRRAREEEGRRKEGKGWGGGAVRARGKGWG